MTVIHEQNAVIGRANRAVAHGATAVASSFPKVERLTPALAAKATMTGNPVRDERAGGPPPALYGRQAPTSRSISWCSAAARERGSSPS